MLSFSNPTEIDPLLITTFGASIKPQSDNPIGFFGTGLKHAISTILRGGGTVTIWSGQVEHKFTTETRTIRGEAVQLVCRNLEPAGFTTQLARTWLPWMAYRELWSNMKDEKGFLATQKLAPTSGRTTIHVDWAELDHVHANRHEFLLESQPLAENEHLSIHPGQTTSIFLRGIKVHELEKPSLYSYNLKQGHLTEDRTMDYSEIDNMLCQGITQLPNSPILQSIITPTKENMEFDLRYWIYGYQAEGFVQAIVQASKLKLGDVPNAPYQLAKRLSRGSEDFAPATQPPTPEQQLKISRALAFCSALGHPVSCPVHISQDLGQMTLAMAYAKQIYLSTTLLAQPTKQVCTVLLEENLHVVHGYQDMTRSFQNALFDLIAETYEKFSGVQLDPHAEGAEQQPEAKPQPLDPVVLVHGDIYRWSTSENKLVSL